MNNSGITRDSLMLRMKEEDWDAVLDTNLKSAFNTVKALQRVLMKSPAGRIINMSSVIGLVGNIGQANYAASKAGLIGFTKSLAQEFAPRKVTCNAIAPGFISTEMSNAIPDNLKEEIVKKIPLKEQGSVEDIAALTAFLASDDARYITGAGHCLRRRHDDVGHSGFHHSMARAFSLFPAFWRKRPAGRVPGRK